MDAEPDPDGERKLTVSLRLLTVPLDPEGAVPAVCLSCQRPMEVHQPDADLPDRMLATCETCKGWHLLERNPDTGTALVVLLPDGDLTQRASRKPT